MIYDARQLKIITDYNNLYYSNIIYRCNNKCPHCISHNTNKRRLNEGVYDILKDIFPITGNYDNDIFIMLGEYGWTVNTPFADGELQFLYDTLEANRNKRCFVFFHVFQFLSRLYYNIVSFILRK